MTKEERELSIEYLEKIKEDYIEGNAYERHPLPEYYAIENAIKALKQEPCEDAVSVTSVFEIMGNLLSIPYDFDRNITEKDVSESMDKIRELPTVTPQEPMVEIDLYSVIKQKYIEREVLDEIRAEIVKKHLSVMEKNDFESGRTYGYEEILEIIDKYKAESEVKANENEK